MTQQSRNLEKLNLVAFYAAPLCLIASSLAYIVLGNGMNNGVVGGFIQCAAMFLFIFPMLGLTSITSEKLPRFSVVFRILLVFGCFMGFLFGIDSVLNATQPNSYTILEMDKSMYVFMMTFGPIWPIALGIFGIVAGVKKILPVLHSVLLSISGFSFPIGRIPKIEVLYIFTDLLLIISFFMIAGYIKNRELKSSVTSDKQFKANTSDALI